MPRIWFIKFYNTTILFKLNLRLHEWHLSVLCNLFKTVSSVLLSFSFAICLYSVIGTFNNICHEHNSSRCSRLLPPSKHLRAQHGPKSAGNSRQSQYPLQRLRMLMCSHELRCPCNSTAQKGQAPTICCTVCKKCWDTNCCNLLGTTPTVTKKLEVQGWKCPWCYKPTIPSPNSQQNQVEDNSSRFDEFLATMARIEACREELNGISSVEFFN